MNLNESKMNLHFGFTGIREGINDDLWYYFLNGMEMPLLSCYSLIVLYT